MFKKRKHIALLLAAMLFIISFAAPLPVSAASGIPVAVTGLTMSSNAITAGQTVIINVNTTTAANSVIVRMADDSAVAGTLTADNGSIRTWSVVVAPRTTQTLILYVGATAEINSLTTRFDLPVTVTGGTTQTPTIPTTPTAANVQILGISETSVSKTVTLTVRTDAAANNTWVRFDNNLYVQGQMSANDASGKTWTIRFNPSAIQTVTVSANTAYKTNGAANEEYTIAFTSSLAPPARPVITSMYSSKSMIYANEYTDITVNTNSETEYVWVKYNNGQTLAANLTSGGATGVTKTWTARISPTSTQTITVYANVTNEETGAVTRAYNITYAQDYYSTQATIEYADAAWDQDDMDDLEYDYGDDYDQYDGESVYLDVEVETNSAAVYVWFDYDGRRYSMRETSNDIWVYDSRVSYNPDEDELTVYASANSSSDYYYSDYDTIDIDNHNGNGSSSGRDYEIISVTPRDGADVDSGTRIDIVVRTGVDIEYVRIVEGYRDDYDESAEDYNTSFTTRSGEHEFELDVRTPNSGSRVYYTIFAYQDDNDDYDEYEDYYEFDYYLE